MRVLLQRVAHASVSVEGRSSSKIDRGLLLLVGVGASDAAGEADALAEKVVHLRIFPDADGKMNRSLLDVGGQALVVSQFTLYGDVRRGRRPSWTGAAPPTSPPSRSRRSLVRSRRVVCPRSVAASSARTWRWNS